MFLQKSSPRKDQNLGLETCVNCGSERYGFASRKWLQNWSIRLIVYGGITLLVFTALPMTPSVICPSRTTFERVEGRAPSLYSTLTSLLPRLFAVKRFVAPFTDGHSI